MDNLMTPIRFLSFLLLLFHSHTRAEDVVVYTEYLPPFQLFEEDSVAGSATNIVKQLLESANLSYELHIVPWARAFNIVKVTPNTLIYSINRTPEREPYFHWIKVVAEIGNSFISLTSNKLNITQLDDAKAYVTAVVREGYAHGILLENGFVVDKNMYVVATLDQQISLLLNGKIDFLFTDIQTVRYSLELRNMNPALVEVNYTQSAWTRDLYLAANINTTPEVLKQLNAQYSVKK
jgi:polar amino acid transport system substrate-binding protein